MKRIIQFVVAVLLLALGATALATPISRYQRFTGNYNFVVTGGSLRNASNATNPCTVVTTSSQALSGIPVGATVVAAYLYWGGSGTTTDSSVTLNSSTVNASRTFTSVMTDGTGRIFFGGFADVTSRISSNGPMTFGGLTIDTGGEYCTTATVVAGWSLVVVYGSSSEPLRAINIFDGLDTFFNSSLSLAPDGFRIPASNIDGKMTAITWEGDDNIGGASEVLTFNSNTLDSQGYNSSSLFAAGGASTTTYGADIDTYNISSYVNAGQTSASTFYSAGGDRVFLAAQIISVTSEPQIDLSITKSHSGSFSVGSNASYTLHVANESGVQPVDYLTTVSDTLPAGLTYVSATGTGWTCGAVGQLVTCSHAAPLASGAAFPDITLTVAVGNAAYPSVSNTATVSSAGSTDNITSNNSATDVATVLGSTLATSTKTVADLNGGEANVGDTLRYTITLTNSSSVTATGVSVTDNVPGNVSGFNVSSIPGGATNSSTGAGTGTNNSGYLNVTNVTVPANGSVTVVFDVVVATGTSPGATIDNTATITNPAGPGATPAAPQVIVSPSLVPGSGTKQLYLINGNGLTRVRPAAQTTVTINEGAAATWVLTQPLQQAVTLNSGNFPVQLWLTETDNGSNRNITVTLSNSVLGTIATVGPTSYTLSDTTPGLFTIVLGTAGVTAPAGSTFSLTITNSTTGSGNRRVLVHQPGGATASRIELNSASIINVNSVLPYNAAYNGGVVTTSFNRGSTVYVRAVVSDPFGSFDISSATITLRDPSGTDVVTNVAMTQVNDSGAALKTYQYSYVIPAAAPAGAWSARVTANEGVEGVTDLGLGTFTVTIPMPTLQVSKISSVVWDPVNLGGNPKRIPGSIIEYTITVSNSGPGAVDASTLIMTDVVPANTGLCVSNTGQCTVVQFADGSPASGLSYVIGNTTFSNIAGGGIPFSYAPSANAEGVDANVTGLRVAPTGSLLGNSGGGNPGFTITFRVRVN